MKINLYGKNIEMTEAIEDYAIKRVTNLEKLLSKLENERGEAEVKIEVGQTTRHHKGGAIFHADCSINIGGDRFYSGADAEDLYAAIDAVKENLFREISKNKDRKQTLFHRGARSVKKMLKGLSRRNPFTGKY